MSFEQSAEKLSKTLFDLGYKLNLSSLNGDGTQTFALEDHSEDNLFRIIEMSNRICYANSLGAHSWTIANKEDINDILIDKIIKIAQRLAKEYKAIKAQKKLKEIEKDFK